MDAAFVTKVGGMIPMVGVFFAGVVAGVLATVLSQQRRVASWFVSPRHTPSPSSLLSAVCDIKHAEEDGVSTTKPKAFSHGGSPAATSPARSRTTQATTVCPTSRAVGDDASPVPRHVAFIMDGNRRFGEREFGAARRLEGHEAGGRKLGQVIEWCAELGVMELTCFAFSTENWKRSRAEVDGLMRTFAKHCDEIKRTAREKNVKVRLVSSDPERLPRDVLQKLRDLECATPDEPKGLTVNLAVSYGARSEIANAARELCKATRRGDIDPDVDVDEAALASHLSLPSAPDLLVRTSGETRLSNFLLWQLAYTELVFLDVLWPDLERHHLLDLLHNFATRHRRFGK